MFTVIIIKSNISLSNDLFNKVDYLLRFNFIKQYIINVF